jgi:phage baseplate assembly protein W
MNIGYPFQIDARGRTAAADDETHVRDLLEQLLFTAPGERVNRPTFGSGLIQLVFAPNSEALAAALQMAVQGALQQWLGDVVEAQELNVTVDDAVLRVEVRYVNRRDLQPRTASFERSF